MAKDKETTKKDGDSRRKRSFFSCDRCKTRKLACVRLNENLSIYEPCATCKALGLDCKTTIQRKRRRLDIKTVSLINKEYMAKILESLYPSVDFNDTSSLQALHQSITHQDSNEALRYGSFSTAEGAQSEDKEVSYVIYSGKSVNGGISSSSSSFGSQSGSFDRIIYDNDGRSHFMGCFGFTGSLTVLLSTFIRITPHKDINSIKFIAVMNKRGSVISSFSEATEPVIFRNINTKTYPLVCYFSRKEADFYVDKFYQCQQSLLSGMNKQKFTDMYDTFWRINVGELPPHTLSIPQYCCIYVVWITGVGMELYPGTSMQDTYELVNRYINLIKILLSDIFLVPSADGILCLLLLSHFFERNMQVETSYILAQTAVCHAMSCGFHRESVATSETFDLWWSLFDREIKLGFYFGRSSTIPLEQVDLNNERRFKDEDGKYSNSYYLTELHKLAYLFLNHKSQLPTVSKKITAKHLDASLEFDKILIDFYDNLPENFKHFEHIQAQEAEILNSYYLTAVNSGFPFILYPIERTSIVMLPRIKDMVHLIERCIESCISHIKLAAFVQRSEFYPSVEFTTATTACCVMVGLVAGALFYKVTVHAIPEQYKPSDIEDKLKQITRYSKILRILNQQRAMDATGTSRVRRYWVEILNEDLSLLLTDDDSEPNTQTLKTMILGDENGSFDQEHKEGEDIVVESGATDNPENYLNPVSIPNLLDMNNFLDGYLSQQSWMSGVLRDMGISK